MCLNTEILLSKLLPDSLRNRAGILSALFGTADRGLDVKDVCLLITNSALGKHVPSLTTDELFISSEWPGNKAFSNKYRFLQ